MKCPKCKGEIFNGQYQCHHCGAWIPLYEKTTEEKETKKVKPKKEK